MFGGKYSTFTLYLSDEAHFILLLLSLLLLLLFGRRVKVAYNLTRQTMTQTPQTHFLHFSFFCLPASVSCLSVCLDSLQHVSKHFLTLHLNKDSLFIHSIAVHSHDQLDVLVFFSFCIIAIKWLFGAVRFRGGTYQPVPSVFLMLRWNDELSSCLRAASVIVFVFVCFFWDGMSPAWL